MKDWHVTAILFINGNMFLKITEVHTSDLGKIMKYFGLNAGGNIEVLQVRIL